MKKLFWGLIFTSDKLIQKSQAILELEWCPPNIHVHPEPQNVTFFENRIFVDTMR